MNPLKAARRSGLMSNAGVLPGLAVAAVLASVSSCAGQMAAEEILKRVSETYQGLGSYELAATRHQRLLARAPASPELTADSDISLDVVKPAKVRLELKEPEKDVILVSNGATTWTYLPRQKQYTKEAVAAAVAEEDDEESGDQSEPDPLTASERLLVNRYLDMSKYSRIAAVVREERIKVGRQKTACYVVELRFSSSTHRLWIDQERFLVVRHIEQHVVDHGNMKFDSEDAVNLKEAEINQPLDNSLFEFTPPAKASEVQALNLPGERVRLIGKAAADFTLKDLQGQKVSLSDFQGKIVLLDFWATWCPPCREELPSIDKLYREYKDKDVVVLGINDEDSGTVKGFLKKNDYSLPTLVDSKRSVHRIYGARAIPTVVVIDRKGVVVAHFVGSRPETELAAALKTAGL